MIDLELIRAVQNPQIKECLELFSYVGKRNPLGIKRWDNILRIYKLSGTVTLPVKTQFRIFDNPFYYVYERVGDQEILYIKPVKGEPYRIGDIYGFFGLSNFEHYEKGTPIFLVEGISDWGAVVPYYPWTLVLLTSEVSSKQLFMLSKLTDKSFVGLDNDKAGSDGLSSIRIKFPKVGIKYQVISNPKNDWGQLVEDSWGQELLQKTFESLQYNEWLKHL